MKADIVCDVCESVLGNIVKKKITNDDIESYRGSFVCECGNEANLVIQPEE